MQVGAIDSVVAWATTRLAPYGATARRIVVRCDACRSAGRYGSGPTL